MFPWTRLKVTFILSALEGPRFLYEVSPSHSDTAHSIGLLWTTDWSVAAISTGQHTNIRDRRPYSRGIRTRNPSARAAVDLRLRPHGYRDRLFVMQKAKKLIKNLKLSLGLQEVEAPRISRQSAHEGGKVVSPTNRPPLPPIRFPQYIFLLEPGLSLWTIPMTPSGMERATFGLVAQCLNQLRRRVPVIVMYCWIIMRAAYKSCMRMGMKRSQPWNIHSQDEEARERNTKWWSVVIRPS